MVFMFERNKEIVPCKCAVFLVSALYLLFLSQAIQAMGLGGLTHENYLGERLDARVEILTADGVLGDNIQVKLLSFAKAKKLDIHIDHPAYGYRFTPEYDGDTLTSYKIYSRDKVLEPYISLVVELTWPGGSLFREYVLLFDAPPMSQPSSPSKPFAYSNEYQSGDRAFGPPADIELGHAYVVRPGDTLSEIAANVLLSQRQATTSKAAMISAIYQLNSHAFLKNNINLLIAGAELQLPNAISDRARDIHSELKANTLVPSVETDASKQGLLTLTDGQHGGNDGYGEPEASLQIAGTQEMIDLLVQENDELRDRIEKIESSDYVNTLTQLVAMQRQQIEILRAEQVDSLASAGESVGGSVTESRGTSAVEPPLGGGAAPQDGGKAQAFSPIMLAIAENFWVVLSLILLVFVIVVGVILYAVKIILLDPARAELPGKQDAGERADQNTAFGTQRDDDALEEDFDRNFHIDVEVDELEGAFDEPGLPELDEIIDLDPQSLEELQLTSESKIHEAKLDSDYATPRSAAHFSSSMTTKEQEDELVIKERIRAKIDDYNASPETRVSAVAANNVEIGVVVGLDEEINELLSMANIYCSAGKYSEARAILTAQHMMDSNPRLLDAIEQIDILEKSKIQK